MTYQVLARKWRPKRFQDVVGQGHIVRSLLNALQREKLGHAYILTGTRGIGKTSVARIFAKALCCESPLEDKNPCNKCVHCLAIDSDSSLDVLEIDGASNNSVDNIRNLIDNIQYLPTNGKYKAYIIDEVHMLTKSAFNALLKTLEEPPKHVIFIFATTEPSQLLGTVLSRCQRFEFRPASVSDLVSHIEHISRVEGIKFESPLLIEKLASLGQGSVRDTLSLFDQVLSFSTSSVINEETMVVALGLARQESTGKAINAILAGDLPLLKSVYRGMINENVEVKSIITSVLDSLFDLISNVDHFKNSKLHKYVPEKILTELSMPEIFWIYESLAKDADWVLTSLDPVQTAEIVFSKITLRRSFFNLERPNLKSEVFRPAGVPSAVAPTKVEEKKSEKTEPKSWDSFLNFLKGESLSLLSNVEQGNLLDHSDLSAPKVVFKIGFPASAQIFKDYLEEREVAQRLEILLGRFYEIPAEKVAISYELIDDGRQRDTNFITKAQEANLLREKSLNEAREGILQNPMIKTAEKLFNTKVDKVVLKEDK